MNRKRFISSSFIVSQRISDVVAFTFCIGTCACACWNSIWSCVYVAYCLLLVLAVLVWVQLEVRGGGMDMIPQWKYINTSTLCYQQKYMQMAASCAKLFPVVCFLGPFVVFSRCAAVGEGCPEANVIGGCDAPPMDCS